MCVHAWISCQAQWIKRSLELFGGPVNCNYLPGRVTIVGIKELILGDQLDILVVGAGDFTFTLTLAAMHGSLKGITSACYDTMPFNCAAEVKLNTI